MFVKATSRTVVVMMKDGAMPVDDLNIFYVSFLSCLSCSDLLFDRSAIDFFYFGE